MVSIHFDNVAVIDDYGDIRGTALWFLLDVFTLCMSDSVSDFDKGIEISYKTTQSLVS